MSIDLGIGVTIPDDKDDEARLRKWADGFFRDQYLWIQVRAIHFIHRHPRYSMEDALNEAWIRLPRILKTYDHERSQIKTYVSKQFKWVWLRHCYHVLNVEERFERFAYVKEYIEPLTEGIPNEGIDTVDDEDERDFIVAHIKHVDAKSQVILSLRYINGMTMQEIADVLGCVKSMVHVYVHRALDQITPILSQTSYGSCTETLSESNNHKANGKQ